MRRQHGHKEAPPQALVPQVRVPQQELRDKEAEVRHAQHHDGAGGVGIPHDEHVAEVGAGHEKEEPVGPARIPENRPGGDQHGRQQAGAEEPPPDVAPAVEPRLHSHGPDERGEARESVDKVDDQVRDQEGGGRQRKLPPPLFPEEEEGEAAEEDRNPELEQEPEPHQNGCPDDSVSTQEHEKPRPEEQRGRHVVWLSGHHVAVRSDVKSEEKECEEEGRSIVKPSAGEVLHSEQGDECQHIEELQPIRARQIKQMVPEDGSHPRLRVVEVGADREDALVDPMAEVHRPHDVPVEVPAKVEDQDEFDGDGSYQDHGDDPPCARGHVGSQGARDTAPDSPSFG